MDESHPSRTCPKCNAPIAVEAAEGLCTRCLLSSATTATDGPGPARGPVEAPTLARVSAAFPQLEIIELIGVGGMGAVFKARQPHLDRYVAVKVLPESLAGDAAFAERFLREARVLARLSHPHIVAVHDFGQADGLYFLLMEYVDGVNLRQALTLGRFTATQALALVPQVCEALQFAHDHGIMHRDIKPENILLDARGSVKLADFGIAKLLGESRRDPGLTRTGAAVGTPQYMAPEQIERPGDVDHRADIYSLGVVFYEVLTGELPIGRFAPPSSKTPLDARIDDIVLRALAKERELRQQSAREVRTEVEGVALRQGKESSLMAQPGEAPLWSTSLSYRKSALAALGVLIAGVLFRGTEFVGKEIMESLLRWDQPLVAVGSWSALAGLVLLVRWISGWGAELVTAFHLPKGMTRNRALNQTLVVAGLGLAGWGMLQVLLGPLIGIQVFLVSLSRGLPLEYGQLLFPIYALAPMVIGIAAMLYQCRRRVIELRGEMPRWLMRLVLVMLLVTATLDAVGWGVGSQLDGFHGFLQVVIPGSLALWSGSRLWRALALSMAGWGILNSVATGAWLVWFGLTQGWTAVRRTVPEGIEVSDALPPFEPLLALVAQSGVLLLCLGVLLALRRTEVRLAFGLPPAASGRPATATIGAS